VNQRELVLVIYAGLLGWYLHKWWVQEREFLVWSAAERASALAAARTNGVSDPPQTSETPSAS